jgi:Fe-S oxidoreductase
LRDRYADLMRERFPRIPRRVSGYNLDELLPENGFHVARALVGSECTCVVVLEATLRLIPNPRARSLLVLGYPDVYHAGDHVPDALEYQPIGLEGLDDRFISDLKKKGLNLADIALLPSGGGWLLVEFGGETKEAADEKARRLMAALKKKPDAPSMKLFDDPAKEAMIWEARDNGLGATAHVPGQKENWEGWEDSAVPPDKVGPYLRDLQKLLDKYEYVTSLYGHFGDGCIHARMDWDLKTADGVRKWRAFLEEAADLVVSYGGSLSGEHGDGQARGELLPRMFGEELVQAFREFKAIWDPDWKMNPGKVVDPYRIDENLRYGAGYSPPMVKTHFQFPDDHFSFAHAMERCVGVGKCRKEEGGTMCPSYMVTREEMHATRGRARLLFEMLQGDPLQHGWKSEAVKEALHLCLSCKGCKGECPVQVDMATYKAEFLSHYYEGRLRPRHAYAFGLIHWWARLAALAPGLVNWVTQTPGLRDLAKAAADMAPERRIPAFAPQTFREWFRTRSARSSRRQVPGARREQALASLAPGAWNLGPERSDVLLWPDTFTNYFHPEIGQAAVEVLEAAGFRVSLPRTDFCCGRPLYDYGMLGLAKQWLRQILDALGPQIEAGIPIVGLEPSCVAVFREELTNFFPNELNAMRLQHQSFLLSEFLEQRAPDYPLPKLARKALVHGHCHHKAIMRMDDEEQVLRKLGLEYEILDAGCCGMAGAFGFEKGDHYDVSIRCGERVLLPAVRKASNDTLIIADGFSCREQIAQRTERRALHLAQVLQMAFRDGRLPEGAYPERLFAVASRPPAGRSSTSGNAVPNDKGSGLKRAAFIAGSALLTASLITWGLKRVRDSSRADR